MVDFDEQQLRQEYLELQNKFEDTNIYQTKEYPELAKRHKYLEDLISLLDKQQVLLKALKQAEELTNDNDNNLVNLAKTEIDQISEELNFIKNQIHQYLSEESEEDQKDCLLEIRAGVGAVKLVYLQLDLYRMYLKFSENKNGN